jgi:hypothetical protein
MFTLIKFGIIFCVILTLTYDTNQPINLKKLNKNSSYLIFRGTETKQGYYARSFNISDSINSHVGILLFSNKSWSIYNVSDFRGKRNDLQVQTLNQYLNCKDGKVTSISIWRINAKENFNKFLLKEIEKMMNNDIVFDKAISLNNEKLYCSEFVANTINKIDNSFKILPLKKKLKGLSKRYFKKKYLEYYPVDIFQYHCKFTKIKKWDLNK